LSDGDVLVVADVEMTFFAGHPAVSSTATLVLGSGSGPVASDSPTDLICELRRLHQTLTLCSIATVFQPIVELSDGRPAAYEAMTDRSGPEPARASAERHL